MPSIIDNREKTMLDSLRKSLKQAETVDILTAFFYFSGFNALAEELKNKKIRILVGKIIDPRLITKLCSVIKTHPNHSLDGFQPWDYSLWNRSQKRKNYIESFIELFNKSLLSKEFDGTESQEVFKMFLQKLNNGTIEIRLTAEDNHAKVYILKNNHEQLNLINEKGVVFMGSSNFTYNGLRGQGEMNKEFHDDQNYNEFMKKFENLWNDSHAIDISTKDSNTDFTDKLKQKLWVFAKPKPYHIFVRILLELYSTQEKSKITTPSEITGGKFSNFIYQIDAIKLGIDSIIKNNGVIVADVVGLGKSIIASAIAYNLDIPKTVIIAPPHLVDQWNDYQHDFGLRGVRVYSSGKLEEIHKNHATDLSPILYIIDEAHRYRNELSESYQYLHQLTRSNAENKVILLTATPYNNRPQDLFALIKLFQTPNRSTINSVDNLGVRFYELIAIYNKLEKEGKNDAEVVKADMIKLSQQLRELIYPVIVRRSRIDLKEIKEYADDLQSQGIKFPEVVGPKLLEYDLGEIRDLYISTLEELSTKFKAVRYNPSDYLINKDSFNNKYGELFEGIDMQLVQRNLAGFIKRLLVMRFESSKAAFRATLDNILTSYQNIKKWWDIGYVPIKKQGILTDPDEMEIEETLKEIDDLNDEPIDVEKIKKKAIPLPRELFVEDFIKAVDSDIELLQKIKRQWFSSDDMGFDPKFLEVQNQINNLLKENSKRKIVVFSSFADTAEYVKKLLEKNRYRVLLYTGGAGKNLRNVVRENFDASYKSLEQKNDYDIIIATDALSEGFNLNRAGVIFNYDIPYNPTRVVQRIGRINRINKKMFEQIFIYNLFPTDIGEKDTLVKGISTLKMLLINNIVGSDTRTLTPDESLESFFIKQYEEANSETSEKSWDIEFKNIYDLIKHDTNLINEVLQIPERARIVRKNNKNNVAISFAKRGNNALFALAYQNSETAEIVPSERVLNLFKATEDEIGYEFDEKLEKKFAILRDEILKPHPKRPLNKQKGQAKNKLEALLAICSSEKDYIHDLLEVISTYDDLSDGEIKYITKLALKKTAVEELKKQIPSHYIDQIKIKAEGVDAQVEVIMFTEDLRNDDK